MPKNRELTGRFLGERHVFGDGERRTIIGTVVGPGRVEHTVRGSAEEDSLKVNLTYRFYGHFSTHPKYGKQFRFNSFVEEKPVDVESIKRYLRRMCGTARRGSVSTSVVNALVDEFGTEAIDVMLSDPPSALKAVEMRAPRSNWDIEKCRLAVEVLREHESSRQAKIELISLFDGRGFPKKTVDRALRKWGNAATGVIRKNPYSLLQLPGIGFKGADPLYCDLAKISAKNGQEYQESLGWIERQSQCARYEITSKRDGSVWYPEGLAKGAVRRGISRTHAKPDLAMEYSYSMGRLEPLSRDGKRWVGLPEVTRHEAKVAACVNDLLNGDAVWPEFQQGELSDHQFLELNQSLTSRIGILSGAPGTGKTYCVATLVREIVQRYGEGAVAIACPTGKAAVRCIEALSAHNLDVQVSTIHRMLIVESESTSERDGGDDSGGGWSFYHNDQNPLPFQFVIVDESSMLDVGLTAALLRALPEGAHVLFVGDAGQLAPVGPGKPFLDMQQCVPTGKLTEIRRNSGRIVQACATMRDRHRFEPSETLDTETGENLPFIETSPEQQIDRLEALLANLREAEECHDIIWNVQVVCAVNSKGHVSRKALNQLLQSMLNPRGEQIRGNPFRRGDKIVCLKNGKYELLDPFSDECDEEGRVFVANGELAEVVELAVGVMTVKLQAPDREIKVPHRVYEKEDRDEGDDNSDKGALGDWDLGYALSCHKSQGSQWSFVIVMLDSSGNARQVQSRNWLYTAVSRASEATFVIGEKRVADDCCRRDGIAGRKTFLVEEIGRDRVRKAVDLEKVFARV